MKRADLEKMLRVAARIDNTEAGELATDVEVLQAIADIVNEIDRLENEVAEGRRRYADAFLNGTGAEPKLKEDEEPEKKEYVFEDYINL